MTDLPTPVVRGFDDHRPPDPALLADCVHCGFCLPTCPTYVLWGEEMDSPRGRILLMDQSPQGAPMTDTMVGHVDACLGCMACVTACPSGVQYDRLIEATRAQVERHHERPRAQRANEGGDLRALPLPARLKAARGRCGLYQRSGLGRLVRRSGSSRSCRRRSPRWSRSPPSWARGARRARAHPGGGSGAVRSGCCWLRPARVLPRRQRGDRQGARRRGVRRPGPRLAGLLRCAVGARRARGGGAGLRARPRRAVSRPRASTTSSSTRPGAARR